MELTKAQKKFIEGKIFQNSIIKGTEKKLIKEALIHRILFLKNNYSYEFGDKIYVIDKSHTEINKISKEYLEIEKKYNYNYYSLLASIKKPEFMSFNELLSIYLKEAKIIEKAQSIKAITDIILKISKTKSKKLNADNVYLILSEIRYIKNNSIRKEEEYMQLINTPLKFRKDSKSRKIMYSIYEKYNEYLKENNLYDYEDLLIKAINNIPVIENRPLHLFINNSQDFSKLELEFLMEIKRPKYNASITFSIDLDKGENIYSSLIKKGRVYLKKVFGNNRKVFNFNIKQNTKEDKYDINDYTFKSLKYNQSLRFNENMFSKEELEPIAVFSNIAAGEPILINPSQEDVFYLPKTWIKGSNSRFILKVKGDSMIDVNINDGDYVVIEQTNSPNNLDIVAVNIEGSATLKRIKMDSKQIILMPENKNYKPIILNEDNEFYILGKAVGIISK